MKALLRRIKQNGGDNAQPGRNEYSPAFNMPPAPSVKPANDYPINPDNFKATVAGLFQSPTPAIRSMGRWQDSMQDFMRAAPFHAANAQAKATTARNNVAAIAADKLDSMQDGLNKAQAENVLMDEAVLKAGGFKQRTDKTYRQELAAGEKAFSDSPLDKPRPAPHLGVEATVKQIQREVKASGANSPETIRAAVFDSFAAIPNPAPLGDAVLNRIADKLAINWTHTAPPDLPANQKPGGTGLCNPALGTAEAHFSLPLQGLGQVKKQPDLSGQPDLGNLTGQVGQVKNSPDLKSPDLTLKLTETEYKLINSEAEKVRLQQQAEAEKVRLQQQAEADRKRAEEAAEAKRQAEQRAIEAERKRAVEQVMREQAEAKMKADLEAAEAEKVRLQQQAEADLKQAEADRKADLERAEAEAEKVRLQQQAEADRKADLGDLTEGQVRLAAEAVKAAILSGQVTGLGRATLKPVLAGAGLPRSTDAVKVLIKWGCTDLIETGLVSRNPEPGNGKPEFVIA